MKLHTSTKTFVLALAVLMMAAMVAPVPAAAQGAGKITRHVAPAFVDLLSGVRPGQPAGSEAADNAQIRVKDVLRTGPSGRWS